METRSSFALCTELEKSLISLADVHITQPILEIHRTNSFFQGKKLQRFYRNLSVLVGLNLQEGNCMGFPHRCMYVKLFCMGRESTMAAFNPSLVKVIKIMTAFENTVQFRENRVQWCSISHKSKSPPSSKFYSSCLCPSSRHFLWITKIDFSTEFHQQK